MRSHRGGYEADGPVTRTEDLPDVPPGPAQGARGTDCAHYYQLDPVVEFGLHWTCRDCGSGIRTGAPPNLSLEDTARLFTEQHGWTFTTEPSAAATRMAEAQVAFLQSLKEAAQLSLSGPPWTHDLTSRGPIEQTSEVPTGGTCPACLSICDLTSNLDTVEHDVSSGVWPRTCTGSGLRAIYPARYDGSRT